MRRIQQQDQWIVDERKGDLHKKKHDDRRSGQRITTALARLSRAPSRLNGSVKIYPKTSV
jgi:hypothetical protein